MPEKQQKTAETLPDVLPADSEMFDDVKPSAPASQPVPQINSMGDMLSRTGKMAGDVGKGMLKGIGNTVSARNSTQRIRRWSRQTPRSPSARAWSR
jgi:hypothetical protein